MHSLYIQWSILETSGTDLLAAAGISAVGELDMRPHFRVMNSSQGGDSPVTWGGAVDKLS